MGKIANTAFYIRQSLQWILQQKSSGPKNKGLTHILYCNVDHYEPGTGGVDLETEKFRVEELINRFPPMSEAHKDSNGRGAQRTWFFPPHYHRNGSLPKLVELADAGYGEIELHLHHGKHAPDTAENLENTLQQCVKEYSEYGIFGEMLGYRF